MVWMYHKNFPQGRIFESEEAAPKGSVDSPAKLGRSPGRPKKTNDDNT